MSGQGLYAGTLRSGDKRLSVLTVPAGTVVMKGASCKGHCKGRSNPDTDKTFTTDTDMEFTIMFVQEEGAGQEPRVDMSDACHGVVNFRVLAQQSKVAVLKRSIKTVKRGGGARRKKQGSAPAADGSADRH